MGNVRVTVADDGHAYLVRLVGELDAGELPQVAELLDNLTGEPGTGDRGHAHLIIDLTGLSHLDAAGIGLFVRAGVRGAENDLLVSAAGATGTVLEVLEATGLAKDYGCYRTIGEALADAVGLAGDEPDAVVMVDRYGNDRVREAAEQAHDLLVRARAMTADEAPAAERLREKAVLVALPYAQRLACRYRNRGEPSEDVAQVACLALVKAVRAYRPGLGHGFVAYAAPTILGEIRRYFRDNAWGLRVPRRLQELDIRIRTATPALTQALGRSPTEQDLARYLQVTDREVGDARAAGLQYRPVSLSQPIAEADATLGDMVGEPDRELEGTSDRLALRQLVAALPERDRLLLDLRFSAGLTQTQIAERLGVSQMQVSRLLRTAITRLRRDLLGEVAAG